MAAGLGDSPAVHWLVRAADFRESAADFLVPEVVLADLPVVHWLAPEVHSRAPGAALVYSLVVHSLVLAAAPACSRVVRLLAPEAALACSPAVHLHVLAVALAYWLVVHWPLALVVVLVYLPALRWRVLAAVLLFYLPAAKVQASRSPSSDMQLGWVSSGQLELPEAREVSSSPPACWQVWPEDERKVSLARWLPRRLVVWE
jgi:hypothetical protein